MITHQQRDALVNLTFSLVPGLHACIAGGFAADWAQAGDIDLWVMSDPLLEKAGELFQRLGVKFTHKSEDSDSVPPEMITRSVVVCATPLLNIHVIGTEEQSIHALLDTFDISTHRWALTRADVQVSGSHATTPYETGRVLTYRFPESTDKRVKRLQERYDITILPYVKPEEKQKRVKKERAA